MLCVSVSVSRLMWPRRPRVLLLLLGLLCVTGHIPGCMAGDYEVDCTTGKDSLGNAWVLRPPPVGQPQSGFFDSSGFHFFHGVWAFNVDQNIPAGVFPGTPSVLTVAGVLSSFPLTDGGLVSFRFISGDYFLVSVFADGHLGLQLMTHSLSQFPTVQPETTWKLTVGQPFHLEITFSTNKITITDTMQPTHTSELPFVHGAQGAWYSQAFTSNYFWMGDGDDAGLEGTITTLSWIENGGVHGDPQFVGLQGQSFQVHGIPDEYFSLVSYPNMQLNSKFTYISSGSCTYNNTACWTHPGTYNSELGLMLPGVRVHVIAGSHAHGCDVYVNDKPARPHHVIQVNQTKTQPAFNITLTHTSHDTVTVDTPLFTFTFINSDMFFNLGMELHDRSLLRAGRSLHHFPQNKQGQAEHEHETPYPHFPLHGLVGVTWRNARYGVDKRMFPGTAEDYLVQDGLWGTNFPYNQYTHQPGDMDVDMQ